MEPAGVEAPGVVGVATGVEMTTSVAEGEAVSVLVAEALALDAALDAADEAAVVAAAEDEAGALVAAAVEDGAAVEDASGTEMLTPYWAHRAWTCSATAAEDVSLVAMA